MKFLTLLGRSWRSRATNDYVDSPLQVPPTATRHSRPPPQAAARKWTWIAVCVAAAVMVAVLLAVLVAMVGVLYQEQEDIKESTESVHNHVDEALSELKSQLHHLNRSLSGLHRDIEILAKDKSTFPDPISRDPTSRSCSMLPKWSKPGYYHMKSANGSLTRVYCHTNLTCGGITGGWTRVTSLDMTLKYARCPASLCLNPAPLSSCINCPSRTNPCSSHKYQVNVPYSKVCGRVIGYQKGSTDGYSRKYSSGFDGVSLSYWNTDQHIWTFYAALAENYRLRNSVCPCINPGDKSIPNPPKSVRDHYFCDTGKQHYSDTEPVTYSHNPLWDGKGCHSHNECCSFNSPPWFYRELPGVTTEDIKMKVCVDENKKNEDIAIEKIDIYVQ